MTEINRGADGIIYSIKDPKNGSVIIKKYIDKPKDMYSLNRIRRIHNEALILAELKKLIDAKICPNFAYMFETNIKYNETIATQYYPLDYIKRYSPYIMQCSYDITLQDFIKVWHPFKEYKSIIFQIYMGIYTFQKYLSGNHNDLLGNNIFIKYINKDIKFLYKLSDVGPSASSSANYLIKTYGYHVVLGDFGLAKIRKPIKRSDFDYLANLAGYITYYIDTNKNNFVINEDAPDIKSLIKKLRRYDKNRPIKRNLYLYLLETGQYSPSLMRNIVILTKKIQILLKSMGINNNVIDANDINLSDFASNIKDKGIDRSTTYVWTI